MMSQQSTTLCSEHTKQQDSTKLDMNEYVSVVNVWVIYQSHLVKLCVTFCNFFQTQAHEQGFLFCLWSYWFEKCCIPSVKSKRHNVTVWPCNVYFAYCLLGTERQPKQPETCFSSAFFRGEIFLIDAYRQGRSESRGWVAAFCFAFVSKQMHSCHSRPHWRLLSNVIASKLIPMDARLQIQLFQVSVKGILQRGMQQKLQICEFKYRRGADIMIHIMLSYSNTMAFVLFLDYLLYL